MDNKLENLEPGKREPGKRPRRNSKDDKLLEQQKRADEERDRAMEKEREKYIRVVTNHKERNRDHNTPFLVIRYNNTDVGLRPIPSGTPHWASPDIWVESSSPLGNPVADEENFLHVRIFNFGAFDAMPVKVDFYWADPSLGLGPANMNLIGTEWVEVKSMWSKEVRCRVPWVPQFLNNGHECVEVNCSCMPLDIIKFPFQPVIDRHVGQRNLHVEQGSAGQAFKFSLKLNNMFNFTLRNQVTANVERLQIRKEFSREFAPALANEAMFFQSQHNTVAELKNRLKAGTSEHRTAQQLRRLVSHGKRKEERPAFEAIERREQPNIKSTISDHSTVLRHAEHDRYMGERLVANSLLAERKTTQSHKEMMELQTIELKPFEQRQIDFEVNIPKDARPGEIVVFNLAQETGNLTLGGYAYAFLIK